MAKFLRLDFARRLMVQVRGSVVTSDAGSLAHRELDDALGLTMAGKMLPDARTGRNGVMRLSGLALPMGTKGLAATFPSRPRCGVATAKEISYVLKTVALSASVLAFASGLAFAETTITREPSTGRTVVTNPSSSLSTGHWLASDVYKASVYDPSEHKIGDVTDLMIDSNGNVTAAIIGVGGFLGNAQKDVVIPFKELKVSTRDGKDWLVLNRTKDELKMAPAYDKKAETKM